MKMVSFEIYAKELHITPKTIGATRELIVYIDTEDIDTILEAIGKDKVMEHFNLTDKTIDQ